jgi:glycosyltransferase involved in cell wall biosynthesis
MSTPLPERVGLAWELTSITGWGVYGLNLTLELLRRGRPRPLLLKEPSQLKPDPLQAAVLQPLLAERAALFARLAPPAGAPFPHSRLPFPVVKTLLPGFHPMSAGRYFSGQGDVGAIFFEDTRLPPDALERARAYRRVVTGSTWNTRLLEAAGLQNVRRVLQGVDPALFHPLPKPGLLRDRFVIFSGGKLELRKGQDLTLAAFRRFRERHPEALLVTAWQNVWAETAADIDRRGLVRGAPAARPGGGLDIVGWAEANGLPRGSVLDLGFVPNADLPRVLAYADLGVFPSRYESGTNLPAMECMACGRPVVLSANTGHLDLLPGPGEPPRGWVLQRQRPFPGPAGWGTDGWGEADVDELVHILEQAYADRGAREARGAAAADFAKALSWSATADGWLALLGEV